MRMRLAVLLSGSGTTLQNLIERIETGTLDVEIVCVVGSRAAAFGLERARRHDIPAYVVARKSFEDTAAYDAALWAPVREHGAALVALAGFMSLIHVPPDYVNRIMNVHPALIPAFSGHGMYGHHVHEAVLAYGAKISGCTVHFVDEEYDNGPIVMQASVPVLEDDTAETLAARVQEKEREIYPEAIQLFAEGRLRVDGRHVRVLPAR